MANRNAEVLDFLRELAQLTVLAEQNPQSFRSRSYDRARHALEGVTEDLSELSESALQKIDGIGKSTAKKIREYFDKGSVEKLEKLRERFPPSVIELSRIPGIGPKTLNRMRQDLGIEDLDGLKRAIDADQLQTIEGLGAKSQQKIAQAIDRLGLKHGEKRTPLYRAMRVADQLVAELLERRDVIDAVPCGSLRRHRETVGDLDIVVASHDAGPIMDWFAEHPLAKDVVAKGETKTSIVTRYGLQVDLRVVTKDQLGAAVMYFTGSKDHNIRLRQRAMQKGWTLNEYALTDATSGEVIASKDETSIYQALDLPYIEPPMREDTGEIEAAAQGALPEPLQAEDLLGDLHVHTDRSGDGRSSLLEMVTEASNRGYTYLAITDHAENLPLIGVSREELERQADEMEALAEQFPNVRLLRGFELNIDRDGGLDYDEEFRAGLDWCIAAVHSHYDLPQAKQTDRIIQAISDPSVRVIGHLTGRMIGARPGIDIDIDAVLDALVDTGVALEINCALPRMDAAAPVLRRAGAKGVTFVVSTDSHHFREMGKRAPYGARQAQRGWVDKQQIANTWSQDRFLGWLSKQRA
ncbi:MAG: DNA polymerase/3'-5' exonuclease PolX [Myxococcota bacterium]